jgi:hypothetical protein
MNIYCINKSTTVSDVQLQSWIPAFNKYAQNVARYWPRISTVVYCPREREPKEAWKLIFADTSDLAGALGYHDYTPGGRPISYVFAADDKRYGYSITITATHEISEMIADPWISELFQVSNTQMYAKEIADPVEADDLGYNITIAGFEPVLCSDFVLPNWFIPGSTNKFDFAGHVHKPLQILAGGYMSVYENGKWNQIYAEEAGKPRMAKVQDTKKLEHFSRLARYSRDRGPRIQLNG